MTEVSPPVASTEDVQNLENENNENSSLVEDQSAMEVDGGGSDDVKTEEASEDIKPVPVSDEGNKIKTEESTEGEVTETPADVAETTEEGTPEVKTEVSDAQGSGEVKEEALEGEHEDSYMVLEEADGDDNDDSDLEDDSLTETERLRKANQRLNERLALLEEFLEVEFSDKFGKYLKKREHLVNVMGYGGSKTGDVAISGKRSPKSVELVGLLKLVNDQARSSNSSRRRGGKPSNGSPSPTKAPPKPSPAANSTTTKTETASPSTTPKRCHRCRSTAHLKRDCPMPLDIRTDRKIILRKEHKTRSRAEDAAYPQLKAMKDKRRRIGRVLNRERQRNQLGRL